MPLFAWKRRFFLLALFGLVIFASSAAGQESERQSPPEQEGELLRIRTDLVQTGVMVFDKQGRRVDGLRREEFELTVDGRPQPVSFFEEVRAGSRAEERLFKGSRTGSPGAPAAEVPATTPNGRGRTVVFFVDDLHLSLDSLTRTRQMLTRFIDREMGEGDLVAIASTSGQLGFLQQFTDNRSVLRAAVARLTQRPYNVRDMSREPTPMTEYMALTIERKDDPGVFQFYVDECLKYASPRYPRRSCEVEVINRARLLLLQAATVISNTYDALKSLMLSSSQLPGRKLVFFVSDGFLLDTGPRNSDPRGKLNEITDAAQRAGVVIYTIDARGLVSGQLDATNNVPFDTNGRLESASLREIPASQDALNALAGDTGGRALRNQNLFDPWIGKVLEETSSYYLLAWRPNNEEQASSDFHNIKVSVVGRPDLKVRLPRGFLRSGVGTTPAAKTKPQNELQAALGAFYPKREVPTSLSVSYLDTPEHGPVLTASMQMADDGLTFEGAGDRQTATVDVAGVVLNDKGKQAGGFQTRLRIDSALVGTGETRRPGTIYNYRLPLAPGLYQVRVAARDSSSGHVGSSTEWIEIPDLSLGRLSLSSLLVGVQDVEAAGAKGGGGAAAAHEVQFSVDHRFSKSSSLRYIVFIYNAAPGGARPDLLLQAQIVRGGQTVLTTPPREVAAPEGSPGRIPYGGEIQLNSLPPGSYTLRVTVTDRLAKTNTTQQTAFIIE